MQVLTRRFLLYIIRMFKQLITEQSFFHFVFQYHFIKMMLNIKYLWKPLISLIILSKAMSIINSRLRLLV